MAALMILGGKLTDRWGRKSCFTVGLVVYGMGALLSAAAPVLASSSWAARLRKGVSVTIGDEDPRYRAREPAKTARMRKARA